MIEVTTGLGLTTITGDSEQLAYFTNLVNEGVHMMCHWAHQVDKGAHYDDSNHSDLPVRTAAFVDEQDNYGIDDPDDEPNSNFGIRQVEIRDATTEEYSNIDFLQDEEIEENKFGEDADIPTHYRILNNSLIFYPKPDTSKVDYFRITYDREGHLFTTSDTTAKPGFPRTVHPILYHYPSMRYAAKVGPELAHVYQSSYQAIYGSSPNDPGALYNIFMEHYRTRNPQFKPRIARTRVSWK